MKVSKEIRDEALRKLEEIAEKTHLPGEFSRDLVLEIFRPIEKENPEVAEFIEKLWKLIARFQLKIQMFGGYFSPPVFLP